MKKSLFIDLVDMLWLPAFVFFVVLLTGCATTKPKPTTTTATLSASLQRQAVATDGAQRASREVGRHLDGLGNDLSRVDGKAAVIRTWLEAQP